MKGWFCGWRENGEVLVVCASSLRWVEREPNNDDKQLLV